MAAIFGVLKIILKFIIGCRFPELMTSFVEFTHGKRLFGTYLYINNLKLDSINHTITEVSALKR